MRTPTFSRALPAYLGGKRRLAPLIFAELAAVLPPSAWSESTLLDPMCGGGAVALWAKAQGFAVEAGDAAERGAVVARALIANSRVRLRREDLLAALACPPPPDAGRPRMDIFTPEQERSLHGVLAAADRSADPLASLLRLVAIKAVLRAFPMSLPNATDAVAAAAGDFDRVSSRRLRHYVRARSRFGCAGLWRLAEEINAGVFGGTGRAYRGDALDAIRTTAADVLYLDPPYPGTTGYGETYAVLDALLGDSSVAGAVPTLTDLLEAAADIPWLVLSYGGPRVTLDAVTELVGCFRTVERASAIPYPRLRAVAKEATNAASREFLVVARR